jgi:hypothetical protein
LICCELVQLFVSILYKSCDDLLDGALIEHFLSSMLFVFNTLFLKVQENMPRKAQTDVLNLDRVGKRRNDDSKVDKSTLKKSRKQDVVSENDFDCRCRGCDFIGLTQVELLEHKDVVHQISTIPACEKCGTVFSWDKDLNTHLRCVHGVTRKSKNTSRKWTCRYEDCGEAFSSRDELWDHKYFEQHLE